MLIDLNLTWDIKQIDVNLNIQILSKLEHALQLSYEFFLNSINYLLEPNKRVYIPYLLSSGLLATYVFYRKKRSISLWRYLFSKKIWWSNSAKVDYGFLLFNSIIKVLFIIPLLILGERWAITINDVLISLFGFPNFGLNYVWGIILYTFCLTIVADFFTYIIHYMMHRVPFLWEFHKVHHSADSLNPFTQYRIHPIELVLNNIKTIIAIGLTTGVFYYLVGFQLQKTTLIGVNIFSFIFLSFGANLRHSHVKLSYYNWLEYFLISPFQHQIHHSNNKAHFDKNLGSKLAIWDYLFGTLIRSNEVGKIEFGLGKDNDIKHNLLKSLYKPFVNVYKYFRRSKVL